MRSNPPPAREASAPTRVPALLSTEQFERLRDSIAAYGGVYLDAAQQRVLEAGVATRLASTGKTLVEYERDLAAPLNRVELRRLMELVVNHETFFFRNAAQFRALRDVLLPEVHSRKPAGEPVRIWSAGCATGEEAYSIGVAATEALALTGRRVEVYGTDLSEAALEKARAGFYRGRSLANVTPGQLARFFRPQDDGYSVGETLRSVVRFAPLNLLDPFPALVQGCDVIFCQNVTIYFQPAARRNLIARFFASLPAGGLLFLGFSETLWNVFDGFYAREVGGAYVYCKGSKPLHAPARPSARPRAEHRQPRMPQRRIAPDLRKRVKLASEVDEENAANRRADADRLVEDARGLADRGDLQQAAAQLQHALERDPLHEAAHVLLGVIFGRQGNWQAAVTALERSRYLSPSDPVVSFYLASAYQQCNRTEQAAREYRSALRKLETHSPDTLLAGVAVHLIRETCERQLAQTLKADRHV
jgi:chemotaxis protein methyltransferase CheR